MITFRIITARNPRGPGYWKLNTHLLTETQYVELIKKVIADVCKEYEGQSKVDKILLWDVLKIKIREASLCYAAARKGRLENKENRLEEEFLVLENKLDERNVSNKERESIWTELRIKKLQLEEIIAYKTQGAILRSKVKWYNAAEKNTKYFHNLEKRHFNSKSIRYLQSANGKKLSVIVSLKLELKILFPGCYTRSRRHQADICL